MMFNPISGIMNFFGAMFSVFLLGGTFYGGLYLGVKSQTNPVAAPIVRSLILGEKPSTSILDQILGRGEK